MSNRDLSSRIHARLDALMAAMARVHGEDPGAGRLLIALSGGPDSRLLLELAAGWARAGGRTIAAAHFNHRIRGQDADMDEQFCREICDSLGITLHCGGTDPRPLSRKRGRGLEEAARRLRLDFLEHLRMKHGFLAIATGHHRNDQVETVIMRLFRGTGLDGLRGMRPISGRTIRPLLTLSQDEILKALQDFNLPWREDATNLDGSNVRGRIRRELMPLVRDIFGPGAADNPARLAELCESDLEHLDALARTALARLVLPSSPSASTPDAAPHRSGTDAHLPGLAVGGLLALPAAIAGRVVRLWLEPVLPADLAHVHVRNILRWLTEGQSGTTLDLPGPLRLTREFDVVRIAEEPPVFDEADRWRVHIESMDAVPPTIPGPRREGETWRLISSADMIRGHLQVRPPRPGDRMRPFGLAGTKKLSDLMQERRIPVIARPRVLVVADRIGVLWAIGITQDERTRVLPTTRRTVTISIEKARRGDDD
jgi:tRNA(Ile)-lysidine synthase